VTEGHGMLGPPINHSGPAGAPTPPGPAPEEWSDAGFIREHEEGVMARPRTGTLRRQPTAQGVSYGVQFRYRGATHYVYLGGSWDGWNAARADDERRFLMEKVVLS